MRLGFFILLLVNAIAFGYFTYRTQEQSSSRPVHAALNAERIRLVDPKELIANSGQNPQNPALACWTWSGFKPGDIDKARAALDKLALGGKLAQPAQETFWLYIPPLKNKKEAEKKLHELDGLGIHDGKVVDDAGKWRFAIGFATYPTEDAATVRLNQLKEIGVKSVQVAKREEPGDTFIISQADEKLAAALQQLQSGYAGTTLKETACTASGAL